MLKGLSLLVLLAVLSLAACLPGGTPSAPATTAAPAAPTTTAPKPVTTPTPAAASAAPFTDDFSNPNSGWRITSDADSDQGYASGEYFIKLKTWGTGLTSNQNLLTAWTNVSVEVDVKTLSSGDEYAGIGFRVTNQALNSLGFYILPKTGMWAVGRTVNDDETFLVKPTASAAIKQGNAVNRLKVVAQGPALQFFVNGQSVGTATDPAPAPGAIILSASRPDSSKVVAEVRFDNFRWEKLP